MRRFCLALMTASVLLGCSSARRRDRPEIALPPTIVVNSTSTTTTVAATTTTQPPKPQLAGLTLKLTEFASVTDPVTLASRSGDSRLFVGQRLGTVQAIDDAGTATEVLNLGDLVKAGGEQGLLGLVFSVDGATAYVHYSDTEGDTTIDAFPVGGDGQFDASRRRHVFGQEQPYGNHNGGQLAVGPDGFLYIGLGDGGGSNDPERRADKLDGLLGKILRIDPNPTADAPYGVPADNPFVGVPDARPEIWHYGLRNPWRFSFDDRGSLWIADVGQNDIEEVNRVPAAAKGSNFGWSAFEGSKRFNTDVAVDETHVKPIHEYEHGDGTGKGCSVTGGHLYRGTTIASLRGAYVFADYCTPGIRAIDPDNPVTSTELTAEGKAITAFGERADGELYIATIDGPIYRLDPA
jgi:glucose/arabinose dehydrogenase